MAFFTLKLSNPSLAPLVDEILAGSQNFVVEQLNQLSVSLTNGSFVFIQLGGENVPWEKGLIGLAEIINPPHDHGYDNAHPRNFRLGLRMVIVLNEVITREAFVRYKNAYDAGGIGPDTRGEQNQAIKSITDIQAYTILRAMVDRQHELETSINNLFDQEICEVIYGDMPILVEKQISYADTRSDEESLLSQYEGKSLVERRDDFYEWMQKQYKSNGDRYKESTAYNYASSLANDANQLADYSNDNRNLFHYSNASEFVSAMDEIKSLQSFRRVNDRGNGTFSAAMEKYCVFLLNLSQPDIDEEDEENVDVNEDSNCYNIKLKKRTKTVYSFNRIIYGAPGTGKTYSTPQYAVEIVEKKKCRKRETHDEIFERYKEYVKSGRVVFTTFHQNYGYEEFIQGLRPDPKSDNLSFKPVDGCFKKLADRALKDADNDYVIIIDEINRANISKVFGELITLIEDDKRWGEEHEMCVTLQSGDVFTVPNNLFIIGTMNSADKSISLIDAALRRRFEFVEQRPQKDLIVDPDLKRIFENLNKHLADKLKSSDLLIGHSYFMNNAFDDLPDIYNNKVIPLLYEYFYDQREKVRAAIVDSLKGYDKKLKIIDDKIGRLSIEKNNK